MELADQLLAEIELAQIPVDQQVLKAGRLARLVGDVRISDWLSRERDGFPTSDPTNEWLYLTRRKYQDPKDDVYQGASQLASSLRTYQAELSAITVPDSIGGEMALVTVNQIMARIGLIRNVVLKLESMLSAVSSQIHSFVTEQYYLLRFAERQDVMFDRATVEIDGLLASLGESTLQRFDSAYANLQAGDAESISAAMNSVRRLIDAFADSVFPATTDERVVNGVTIKLGEQQKLNRIKAFIDDQAQSDGRAHRLKRAVSDIYERVSAGVHRDVAPTEAEYLMLSAYVLLGEILALRSTANQVPTDVTVR